MLEKYKFISKGEWFKQGTEVKVVEDCFWLKGAPTDSEGVAQEVTEINLEKKEDYFGLFEGIRINKYNPAHKEGEEYLDQEVCSLEEFEVSLQEIKV